MDSIIDKTIVFVKEALQDAERGHDWFHIERVYRNALLIAKEEVCNHLVVELGALLHDIADSKFHHGDELLGPTIARAFLEALGVEEAVIFEVEQIIKNCSFSNRLEASYWSVELAIVRDADRLDAMGAIGIARAFHFGGYKNRLLYDPCVAPALTMSKEAYKKANGPTINHFYEKLLLLKDLMQTDTGKKLAVSRHEFMEQFLDQFYTEWHAAK